jgi:predicted amidohydrolase YtcJ
MSETVLFNGNVVTLDEDLPIAESVVIKNGRIAFVGGELEARRIVSTTAEWTDLDGRTVVPGFNDNHIHAVLLGHQLSMLNLQGLNGEQIVEVLRERFSGVAPGRPIFARSWDYPACPHPHRDLLDRHFPDNPVVLFQFSGHALWANSLALQRMGVGPDGRNPHKGIVERDENGQPTGIVKEANANRFIRQHFWKPIFTERETTRELLETSLAELARVGVTSVQDNTWFGMPFKVIQNLYRAGKLTCRFSCWRYGEEPRLSMGMRAVGSDEQWFRPGPWKFFLDGAFSSHTAWLTEPYADQPDTEGSGKPAEEVFKQLAPYVRRKRQVACHAIGDRAIKELGDAVQMLQRRYPWTADLRLRIEHGQLIRREDMPRLRELGILVCAQPSALVDPAKDERLLGPERAARAYPYRSLLQEGVALSFGSDFPGESLFNPLRIIHLAVNRGGPEGITARQALKCYTLNSAFAEGSEREKGSISVGKYADLAVLSADPLSVAPEEIGDIEVEMTLVNGKTVFRRSARAVELEGRLR